MKRRIALGFALLMALGVLAGAVGEALPEYAVPTGAEEALVQRAIFLLKQSWQGDMARGQSQTGHIEIRNTRVICLNDPVREDARGVFPDGGCVIEFTLFTDLYGSAPYYMDAGIKNCLVADKNGMLSAVADNPFRQYAARTYSYDFSGIIAQIRDFGDAFNGAYDLLPE